MIRQHGAWHAIMAIGQYTQLDDVGRGNAIIALRMYTWSDDFERGMPSLPLERYTIKRRLVWHVIIALRKHTRLDYVWHCMSARNLGSTHGRMTLGVKCYHCHWAAQAVE